MIGAELEKRTYGVETEYSCLMVFPGSRSHEYVGSCHSDDVSLGLYAQPESAGAHEIDFEAFSDGLRQQGIVANSQGMLSNGGRFYIDPSGLEYCTPEATTAGEATLRMFDGDRIVHGIFRYLCDKGMLKSFQLNRKIVDHNRSSRGIHINTSTELSDRQPSNDHIQILAALNVAKGSLFGSGGLLLDENGNTQYHHSPRLSLTTGLTGDSLNYNLRPLVRIPFKPDHTGARIETVTSDALNFAWPMRASLVITSAVVGLIELGYGEDLPKLDPVDAVESAQSVGRDGYQAGMKVTYSGIKLVQKPHFVLRNIADLCLRRDIESGYLDEESRPVLEEIIITAEAIDRAPFDVVGQVESVARLEAITRKLGSGSLDSERACRLDYAWDLIGSGTAEELRSRGKFGWKGFGERVLLPSVVKKRLITPPQDTRSKIRAQVIVESGGLDDSTWSQLDVDGRTFNVAPNQTKI